jgi:hypothetical protein
MKKAYARSVEVYGEQGFLFREAGWFAEKLVQEGKAERICQGKLVRALRLLSPNNPDSGHETVSTLLKFSRLGQTRDTGTTYMMREYGSRTFAPRQARRFMLQVLAEAGAEIRKCR